MIDELTAGVIVGGILLASDELLRMEELAIRASSHLIHYRGLQINEHSSWDVFPGAGFAKEGVEGVISTADCLIRWHLAIGLNTMLQAVELPASIADLDTSLANVN